MKKITYIIITILFLLFFWLLNTSSYSQQNQIAYQPAKIAEIKVLNERTKTLDKDHNFVGVNFFDEYYLYKDFLYNPELLNKFGNFLKDNNIDLIRYPSGIYIVATFWDVPYAQVIQGIAKMPVSEHGWLPKSPLAAKNKMSFFDFMEFCKTHNIKSTIQVNSHSVFDKQKREIVLAKKYFRDINGKRKWSSGIVDWQLVNQAADYAASQVKWVKDNGYSDLVKYWEIGNEEYSYAFLNSRYTGDEYAKVSAIFIEKMKQIDPEIKILITNCVLPPDYSSASKDVDISYLNNWTKDLLSTPELKKYKSNILAVTSHIYTWKDALNNNDFEIFKKNIYRNPEINIDSRINYHAELLKQAGYNNTKIYMNEFTSNHYDNPYSHTWLGGLGVGKMILSCANNINCYGADYHNLMSHYKGINFGMGMMHFAKDFPSNQFISYPVASVISFINANAKGDVLKSNFDDSKIFATSVKDGNKINVIILNLENDKVVNLDLTDFNDFKYTKNTSIGIGILENFTVLNTGDDFSSPKEVRLINSLDNAIKINAKNKFYYINMPKNTIASFVFEEIKN